jgi:hypothetical protein
MEVWVVLIDDTHADTEPYVFTHASDAVAYAVQELESVTKDRYDDDEIDRELNDAMTRAGWIWFASYGESNMRVQRKILDAPNAEGTS